MRFRFLLFVVSYFFTVLALAQGKVAIQSGNSVTFVDSLETAVAQAQPGDVIYIPGGAWSNDTLIIDKPITLIGVGMHPDSTAATSTTIIQGKVLIADGASNSVFMGIMFTACISAKFDMTYASASNVLFSRCYLLDFDGASCSGSGTTQHSNFSNFTFDGCVFDSQLDLSYARNFQFTGCAFNYSISTSTGMLRIAHSIFFSTSTAVLTNHENIDVQACAFISSQLSFTGTNDGLAAVRGCVFVDPVISISSFNVELESGNVYGVPASSLFENFPGGLFSFEHDYHPSTNSPLMGAGVGGVDCGLYGGPNPWKEGAVPLNPHISYQSIGSNTNAQGGLPTVIKVNAQNR